jgi:D-amino peptidase
MKVLISAEMEGVAGITNSSQCRRDTSEFARSCQLMTAEVRAACEGAVRGGATSIVVNDSHGDMRNILHEALPEDVELIQGQVKPNSMVQGIDRSIDAVAFVGYHAPAATTCGILDHTINGAIAHRVLINGETCSEARINAAVAGQFGVPVVFLSGDQSACADATGLMPWIKTAKVKEALGRPAARSMSPTRSQETIAHGIESGLNLIKLRQAPAHFLAGPITLDLSCMNAEMADSAAILPRSQRLDATTVRYVADDAVTTLRALRITLARGAML